MTTVAITLPLPRYDGEEFLPIRDLRDRLTELMGKLPVGVELSSVEVAGIPGLAITGMKTLSPMEDLQAKIRRARDLATKGDKKGLTADEVAEILQELQ